MSLKTPESSGFHGIMKTAPKSACNTHRGLTRISTKPIGGLADMLPKLCSFADCHKTTRSSLEQLCEGHRSQKQAGKQLRPLRIKFANLTEMLDSRTDKSGNCWRWTGHLTNDGYGRQRWKGSMYLAHRLAYANQNGPIPEDMQIDHKCRNRACVNPAHLRTATHKQNRENLSKVLAASGYLGVSLSNGGPTWKARVTHNGEHYDRRGFATAEEADAAAREMRLELFTHNIRDRVNS